MPTEVITITALFSFVIWIAVSREAVKPPEKIKWKIMILLLTAGTLSTLILTISLFQNFPFFR